MQTIVDERPSAPAPHRRSKAGTPGQASTLPLPASPCLSQLHVCGGARARRLRAVVEALTAESLRLLRRIEWGDELRSSGPLPVLPVTSKEAPSEPQASRASCLMFPPRANHEPQFSFKLQMR